MSSKCKRYKVKLTPVGKFFFGGEIVFGGEGEGAQSERRRSYLVNSNVLPQQTSLLGMLREQLLRQNNLLLSKTSSKEEIEEAVALVGNTGFNPSLKGTDKADFGIIESISALVLEDKNGNRWEPLPADMQSGKNGEMFTFVFNKEVNRPEMQNMDAKDYLSLAFTNAESDIIAKEDLFVKNPQVGITVSNRHKGRKDFSTEENDDEEGFYRQTFLSNGEHGFSFVFYVEAKKDLNQKLKNTICNFGGERSLFSLEITDAETANDNLFMLSCTKEDMPEGYNRTVLLSDSILPAAELNKYCLFAFAQTVPFRFFTTVLDKTKRFYDLNETDKKQSKQYTLLERGSVLYTKEEMTPQLESALESYSLFKQIGYNVFKTV